MSEIARRRGQILELVAKRSALGRDPILGQHGVIALGLQRAVERRHEQVEFLFEIADALEPLRILRRTVGFGDRGFQLILRRQRCLGVIVAPGHDVILNEVAIGHQIAIDISGGVGFGNPGLIGIDASGDPFEPDVGESHADRGNHQKTAKPQKNLAAKSQSRHFRQPRARPYNTQQAHFQPPNHSLSIVGMVPPRRRREARAESIRGRKPVPLASQKLPPPRATPATFIRRVRC